MKKPWLSGAIACAGAVIGAGFASGREIVGFFTRFGVHSWWLIVLSCGCMGALCALILRKAGNQQKSDWCGLFAGEPMWLQAGAQLCCTLLMIVTGGAMISASGHMVALVWHCDWAYAVGAAATLAAAWGMGFASLRPVKWLSAALTVILLLAMGAAFGVEPQASAVWMERLSVGEVLRAAIRAVAYAGMNLTLALGVLCRCAQAKGSRNGWTAMGFGILMLLLLLTGNALYIRHPQCLQEAFPLVRLLSSFGRKGFLVSVLLMYLSVLTTQSAVLYGLRSAVERYTDRPYLRAAWTLGLPLGVSCVGFEQIVDGLYAPAGLLCLALVFAPLMRQKQTNA